MYEVCKCINGLLECPIKKIKKKLRVYNTVIALAATFAVVYQILKFY